MNNAEHIAKRHRAEKRFQFYGKAAIAFALLALFFLLYTIITTGWQSFLHAQIRLTLPVDNVLVQDKETLKHTDFNPVIKQALLKQFPQTTNAHDIRELTGLMSSGSADEVRTALLKRHILTTNEITLWLPASDAVDRAMKAHFTEKTPENERKITNQQLAWLDTMTQDENAWLGWNKYFFATGDSREPELAGFMGSLVGSLFTLFTCVLVAFPVGVMAAMYLEEFAKRNYFTGWIEITINNLAAVPSVVFGLLGLALYLNVFGVPRSASFAGGLTLALMILPTIIIATRASLRAIPDSIRDAARALGATPLQVVLHHSFPLAIPGIMTGTILGLARAMGETAPLLMIGMVAFIADIPRGIFDPATAMPVQIYLWATSPEPSFVGKTAAGILILIIMLILMNSIAIIIRKRFEHRW